MALEVTEALRARTRKLLWDEHFGFKIEVPIAAAAVLVAASAVASLGALAYQNVSTTTNGNDVASFASDQLGETVTSGTWVSGYIAGTETPAVSYELTSVQTGSLVAFATLTSGDPATAADICPVDATDVSAAYAAVTQAPTDELTFVCIDGKWGVQGQSMRTRVRPTLVGSTLGARTVKVPVGTPRQAGPAFSVPGV